jgi:Glycosyl transferase family 2
VLNRVASPNPEAILEAGPEVWVALGLGLVIVVLFLRALLNRRKLPKLTGISPVDISPGEAADDESQPSESLSATPSIPQVDCMVVIPARDESGYIGDAVRSLPPDSVIVVDDHSEDSTAEEAREAGAGVIPAPDLLRTSSGKANACMAGARALTSRWILFADADTRFAPGFLNAAIARAESSGVALLSVYLDPDYATIGEHVLTSYLIALFFCGTNPRSDPASAFNGQCLLARRDAYRFLGGHAAVANSVNEDVRLAGNFHRHRLTLGIARANGLGTVRWRDLVGAVERGAFRFMIGSSLLGATALLIAALAMAAWIPVLVWLLIAHQYLVAAGFVAVPWLLLWGWYGRGWGSLAALGLPIAIYAALPMLGGGLWAALKVGAVEWKGRTLGRA